MGERAKKKRAEESKAARAAKKATSQLEEGLPTDSSDIELNQSSSKNTKQKSAAAPVPSVAPTRRSARSVIPSSKLGSGDKHTSAKGPGHDDNSEETTATRPKRAATGAANKLLQQLQISRTESTDFEDLNSGESKNKYDNYYKIVLTVKNQMMAMI